MYTEKKLYPDTTLVHEKIRSSFADRTMRSTFYKKNGDKIRMITTMEYGSYEYTFYRNNKPSIRLTFDSNHKLHGISALVEYDENGFIISDVEYTHGNIGGNSITYNYLRKTDDSYKYASISETGIISKYRELNEEDEITVNINLDGKSADPSHDFTITIVDDIVVRRDENRVRRYIARSMYERIEDVIMERLDNKVDGKHVIKDYEMYIKVVISNGKISDIEFIPKKV